MGKNEYPISRPARRDPAEAGNIQLMKEKQNTKKLNILSHEGLPAGGVARRHEANNNGKFYFSLCLCVFVRECVQVCGFFTLDIGYSKI